MKAADPVYLERTVGDTDPFLICVTVKTDTFPKGEPIPDSATVTMKLDLPSVVVLPGVARGDGLGFFSFDTTSIAAETQLKIPYQMKVTLTDGVTIETPVRGTITNKATIA